MHNTPIIKIYPNPNSRVIDETCVSIISKGLFFSDVDEYAIPAFLSYENKHGEIIDKEFFINIKNGAVDEASPIHIEPFVYDGELKFKRINIIVRCHDKNDTAISFIDNPDDISNWVTIC